MPTADDYHWHERVKSFVFQLISTELINGCDFV